ncbi:MAG: Gfo/Idh/MocA family oxidoreductase [Bacteroidota bacterium]|nr:Gfo/Idh/MocA family oxidoreductase [Bacteroidota bacterium]
MKNFALIGVGGYIAPRHLRAIRDTGNRLVAALDKNDSVGILDAYFPEADFFTEFERFDRHLDKIRRKGLQIDYLSVCSPNYLHDAHIRFGLRIGSHVICEKPVVLNPWNIDALVSMEAETGRKAYTLMQLRLHPRIRALKEKISQAPEGKKYSVSLQYITARGHWYFSSWKGDLSKSGGIATNIGIHFFDLLLWIFGPVVHSRVSQHDAQTASGILELQRATVDWKLSIDAQYLPASVRTEGKRTYRNLSVDGESLEFSEGLEDLHTEAYRQILEGKGFPISEAKASIELVHQIRNQYTL